MSDTDKRIKEAWEIIVDERSDTIPREEELKDSLYFSKEFPEQRTRHLPEKFIYIRGKTFSKLVVCIVILIILASSVTVYAVVQMLERHINDINTDIRLSREDIEKTEIEDRYFPVYIPLQSYIAKKDITDNTTIVEYTDGHREICFRQELSTGEGSFDNENTDESLLTINGAEAVYFEKHNEKTLIFSEYGYVFYIDTNSEDITKEQLIHMAESIEKESGYE